VLQELGVLSWRPPSEHSPLSALADGAKWWPGVCNNCLVITPHSRHDDLNTELAQIADIDPVETASSGWSTIELSAVRGMTSVSSSVLKSPARITREVVGNLISSTPIGSRSASPYQRSSLTFQEPIQQVELISPCATTYPWPDPADSHALIPQVPWIPSSWPLVADLW